MADKCSIAPAVVWNWVIEALASSEQADVSTLIGLVKMAPAISGDAGKATREIASFRILESLFDHSNEATVDVNTPKISFDSSERCEDVLKKILHETPEQMAKLEKERWDVRLFLKHKRSSLRKCLLKKLKEGILENSNPLLASLKEKSKIVFSNASEDTSPDDDDSGPQDAHTEGHNKRVSAANMENLEFVVKSKDSNNTVQPNNERVNNDNSDPLLAALKEKSKVGIPNASEDTSPANDDDVPQDMHTEEHNKRVLAENMENLEFVVKSEDSNNSVQLNNGRANDENSTPFLAALKENSKLVTPNASEDTSPANNDNVPQDTHTEEHNKRVSAENMETLEFVVRSKDSNNSVQPNNERANDDDDDERNDIAAKKEAFLKSQCTISQDPLTLTEWSEIDLCMKCNESGDLLVCSSDSCPLQFHESCLGAAATLEENGEFFCPFCAYSRAISKYQESKRKASLARKKLQAFSNFTVRPRPNKSSTKESELEESEDRQMVANNINCMSNEKASDPMIPDENEDTQMGANNINCMPNEKESDLHDPMIPDENVDGEMGANSINCMSNEKDSGLPDPMIPDENEDTQMGANNINCMSNKKDPALPDPVVPDVNDDDDDPSVEQTTELPQNPIPEPSTPKQKFKEKESQRSTESSLSTRLRKRKAKHIPPPVPPLRRKKLSWTKSEEETLKEGVERYSSANDTKIPWKEILDFGHNVFHKERTTIDLKDKWRNMCK